MNFRLLAILAAVFWVSTIGVCVVAFVVMPEVTVIRFAAIPDAVFALAFTALAAWVWANDSRE